MGEEKHEQGEQVKGRRCEAWLVATYAVRGLGALRLRRRRLLLLTAASDSSRSPYTGGGDIGSDGRRRYG